jgi:hypothetical protein
MISNDLLLTASSICFVICAIPQLVRNWKYKDTFTQSLLMNGLILVGTILTVIAYIDLHIYYALIFLIVEAAISIILLIQIVLWRNNKKKQALIEQTAAVRSFVSKVKGVK